MTTLTAFQTAQTEAIWNQLEDANEGPGSLTAALQDRIGTLGDFFGRYFEQNDKDIEMVIFTLVTIADKLSQNFDALCDEMMEINFFDTIDAKVKADGGNEDDANAVQNMIAEQHWIALTAELRYLAQHNNNNEVINNLADLAEAANKYLLNALYA